MNDEEPARARSNRAPPWFLIAGLATGIAVGGYDVVTGARRS